MNRVNRLIGTEAARNRNLTGRGVGIAVLDTGVYPHPDFAGRLCCFQDMVGGRKQPYDDNSHGTHVMGVLGGSGKRSGGRYEGVAPGASLIGIKVLDREGNGSVTDLLRGLSWIRKQKKRYGIRIVNISVGSVPRRETAETSALVRGVEAAWADGLVVIVAAGNEGPEARSVTTPGISRKVITVGCSDDQQSVRVGGISMVDYSGRGPTVSCICKPDVVAPGAAVVSCCVPSVRKNHYYGIKSGTSMATPVVSGAAALLLEKYPYLTPKEVKLRLLERARDLGLPRNQQGRGMVDLAALLRE
ncbi:MULTISPECIES: S8 family peptidase [unclassified Candidatus Paralachnospira]|uniref:S8 family peptidase n=1 Tax=unclassified Candidatus Paralachnospira TaxID=3099471 RepID=UPI003F92ACB7